MLWWWESCRLISNWKHFLFDILAAFSCLLHWNGMKFNRYLTLGSFLKWFRFCLRCCWENKTIVIYCVVLKMFFDRFSLSHIFVKKKYPSKKQKTESNRRVKTLGKAVKPANRQASSEMKEILEKCHYAMFVRNRLDALQFIECSLLSFWIFKQKVYI